MREIVLDTETTGLDPQAGHRVVEVGCLELVNMVATGITFHPTDAAAFAQALRQLLLLFADQKQWAKLQRNAMAHPVGWETSAAAYADLYESLLA